MNPFDMIGLTQPAAKPVQAAQKPNDAVSDDGFAKVISAEEQAGQGLASERGGLGAGPEDGRQSEAPSKTAILVDPALTEADVGGVAVALAGADSTPKSRGADVKQAAIAGVVVAPNADVTAGRTEFAAAKSGQVAREVVSAASVVANPTVSGDAEAPAKGAGPLIAQNRGAADSGTTPMVRMNGGGGVLAPGSEAASGNRPVLDVPPSTRSTAVAPSSNSADMPEAGRQVPAPSTGVGDSQNGAGRRLADALNPAAGGTVTSARSGTADPIPKTPIDPILIAAPNNASKLSVVVPVVPIAPDPGVQRASQQKDAKVDLRVPAASAMVEAPELPKVVSSAPTIDAPVAKLASPQATGSPAPGWGQASFSASMTSDQAAILSGQTTPQQVSATGTAPINTPTPAERALVQQVASAIPPGSAPGRIEFMLDPPELGRIEIAIEVADQSLRATLSAERQVTADLIRRHMDLLNEQFREAGFSDVDLSFADQHGESERSFGDADTLASGSLDADQPAQVVRPVAAQTISTSRMDVRL